LDQGKEIAARYRFIFAMPLANGVTQDRCGRVHPWVEARQTVLKLTTSLHRTASGWGWSHEQWHRSQYRETMFARIVTYNANVIDGRQQEPALYLMARSLRSIFSNHMKPVENAPAGVVRIRFEIDFSPKYVTR
jgi:hypothetical protein